MSCDADAIHRSGLQDIPAEISPITTEAVESSPQCIARAPGKSLYVTMKCDIKELRDTHPKKHRLRVGEYRVIYAIDNENVKIIDLIQREAG
jgi:hypothetical protein